MIILGIDPGYAIVGYGVTVYDKTKFKLLDYGAITTNAGTLFEYRIKDVYDGINELINKYNPDAISIEQLFFTSNQKTAIMVAQARGVVLLAATNHGIPIYEYTPLQVKQSVVGYGRAEKKQVMEMTRIIMGLDKVPKPDDAADALAVAICHGHSSGSLLAKKKYLEMMK